MDYKINIFSLAMPFAMGMVNCYLVETKPGYLLIDTGGSSARKELLGKLESIGYPRQHREPEKLGYKNRFSRAWSAFSNGSAPSTFIRGNLILPPGE